MTDFPPGGRVVAAVLSSLSPFGSNPITDEDKADFEVPRDWQSLAAPAQFLDLHGVGIGLPHGYVADLLGRAAAGGEQLAMSLSAVRDAEVWLTQEPEEGLEYRRLMAGRALAEASGLWTIAAGHAAVNVAARVLRVHKAATYLDSAFKWEGPPPPFSAEQRFHCSINRPTVKALSRAARETSEGSLVAFVAPLATLLHSAEWESLEIRRHIGYHRFRPQSIEGGALTRNPWIKDHDGVMTLSVGEYSGHVPPAIDEVVAEARAGHDALSTAMGKMLAMLPSATRSAGLALWTEPSGPDRPSSTQP